MSLSELIINIANQCKSANCSYETSVDVDHCRSTRSLKVDLDTPLALTPCTHGASQRRSQYLGPALYDSDHPAIAWALLTYLHL